MLTHAEQYLLKVLAAKYGADSASPEERAQLVMLLAKRRLDKFTNPFSDRVSVRCQLNWSIFRCEGWISPATAQVDHIRPQSKNGSDDPANLQVACPTCNREKGAQQVRSFLSALTAGRLAAKTGGGFTHGLQRSRTRWAVEEGGSAAG